MSKKAANNGAAGTIYSGADTGFELGEGAKTHPVYSKTSATDKQTKWILGGRTPLTPPKSASDTSIVPHFRR